MLNVKKRQYPNGWHTIKATLDDFEIDMCIARAKDEQRRGKREVEAFWPLVQIRYQQSRYIYDMFYTRKIISKELDTRFNTICICRVPKSKLEAI
ncbi:hypothetical protein ACJMK2_003584 [Sinanodonta woodiana]|uniref:Uncharacterized protein n=1 Tax=Sinanodonta woodiana TaxID=1069815 RepID=A0ABD3Y1U3_SINWO